jgi:hypothetical protein
MPVHVMIKINRIMMSMLSLTSNWLIASIQMLTNNDILFEFSNTLV